MDSWRVLPVSLDKYLTENNFYKPGDHLFSGDSLSLLPNGITFRDRFTAAFMRYLVHANKTPEEAIAPFGRSWRHFQRYLTGGNQTPKMDVVVALASASGVPVEWIIGGPSRHDADTAKVFAEVQILEYRCGEADLDAVLVERAVMAQLPSSILHAVQLSAQSAKLVVVQGGDRTTTFRDGDMLLLDSSDNGRTVSPTEGVYLLKIGDAAYLQNVALTEGGLCLSDQGEYGGVYREYSDLNAIHVIGRAVWVGRSL
jgi:hypothetical protein